MKHIFIINPVAGKKKAMDLFLDIYKQCEKNHLFCDCKFTKSIGDATFIAEQCAKGDEKCTIYSVGGDGTLNEVVNGIVNTNATLGVIPTGSGNDFFRVLSDDNNKEDIINRTINGNAFEIDLGKVNSKYFINIASLGLDADIAANISLMKRCKIIPNNMLYYASIFYTLFSYESPNVQISFNDITLEQQITLLAICNGQYYGNGIPIAPRADLRDNVFDVYLADKVNRMRIPLLLLDVLKGEHEKYNFVHPYQTDYIKVEAEKPINCNIDGEIITSDNFSFGITQNRIKVLKPKKATF